MKLEFEKYTGLGNDFIFINKDEVSEAKVLDKISVLCDRKFGIGADGIIFVGKSARADFSMDYFNADSSKAKCGNGLRCSVAYALSQGFIDGEEGSILIDTETELLPATYKNSALEVEVDMGPPIFEPSQIPCTIDIHSPNIIPTYTTEVNSKENTIYAASIGNPHAISFCEDRPEVDDLNALAYKIREDGVFPEGVNVELVQVVDKTKVEVKVNERGVGVTLACGTGACAVFAVAFQLGFVGNEVTVIFDAGEVDLRFSGDNILLKGPAQKVYTGQIEI